MHAIQPSCPHCCINKEDDQITRQGTCELIMMRRKSETPSAIKADRNIPHIMHPVTARCTYDAMEE